MVELPLSSISSLKASGLTTTKEGKSGEQIITDVYMYKPTTNLFTEDQKNINKIMDITSLQRDTGFDTEGIYDLFTSTFFITLQH
jgi:hypothetical protein